MGDYLLQSVRNNGRNVYKHNKEAVYLYSLDVYEHADDADYETLKDWAGTWVVSVIKYYIIIKDQIKFFKRRLELSKSFIF